MLRLYAPVAVAAALILGLSAWESLYSDRFTNSSITAADFGKRFANVPMKVGPWEGEERKEEAETLEMAGAVNHVSRHYINTETNATVDLWLIVGHSRDICRHTPDICYPSHGFGQIGSKVQQRIEAPGEQPATFFTAKFRDESSSGSQPTRVFWSWNGNREGQYEWEAPEPKTGLGFFKASGPKMYYGNNTALYKMYFTARMANKDEPVAENIAIEFAKLMIPKVNRALFPERYAGEAAAAAAVEPEAPAPAATAAPIAKPEA